MNCWNSQFFGTRKFFSLKRIFYEKNREIILKMKWIEYQKIHFFCWNWCFQCTVCRLGWWFCNWLEWHHQQCRNIKTWWFELIGKNEISPFFYILVLYLLFFWILFFCETIKTTTKMCSTLILFIRRLGGWRNFDASRKVGKRTMVWEAVTSIE